MPNAQHVAAKTVQTFDGIHCGVVASGKQPKGIPGPHGIFDIGHFLGRRDFQRLADTQQIAGQPIQAFDGIHCSIISLGNKPEAIPRTDYIVVTLGSGLGEGTF